MIYLDHSATSLPKHPKLNEWMNENNHSASTGRSGYGLAIDASRLVYDSRCEIARLLNLKDERGIIFTNNATMSLNFAIQGLCRDEKKKALCSSLEHNAVMRNFHALEKTGQLEWSQIREDNDFYESLEKEISEEIDFVVVSHVDNVTGRRLNLQRISEIVKKHQCILIIDAAQSFGCEPIDMNGIDILCASAHKGLKGPMGLGILAIQDNVKLPHIFNGGTGSSSNSLEMPEDYPDTLEVGTLNVPAIIATGKICQSLSEQTLENYQSQLQERRSFLIKELNTIGDKVVTHSPEIGGTAVSIDIPGKDLANIAHTAWKEYGICVRVGLHCAPFSHTNLGTFPNGTLRISPSYETKLNDLKIFTDFIKSL